MLGMSGIWIPIVQFLCLEKSRYSFCKCKNCYVYFLKVYRLFSLKLKFYQKLFCQQLTATTFSQINEYVDQLAVQHEFVETVSMGKTYENRDMRVLQILKAGEGKANVFFEAGNP